MKRIIYIIYILALTACVTHESDKPTVTVSIEPLRFFTEQIAGNRINVETMVPGSSNPETYEPTAQQLVTLSHSSLFFKVGNLGFEQTWMHRLKQNAPHLTIVNVSEGVEIINAGYHPDPHTWSSCANARKITFNIYKALAKLSPKDSLFFRHNLKLLHHKIKETDDSIKTMLKKNKNKSFLIYHPDLTYFARDYALTQIPIEIEGREPSAAQLQQVIATAKAAHTQLIFIQQQFSNRNIQVVANSMHAQQVEINPLNYQWHKEMIHTAQALCNIPSSK